MPLLRRLYRYCALLLLLLALPLAALAGYLPPRPVLAAPPVRDLQIGLSAQGRPINAVQIGDGPYKLVVVGNTHGGAEFNTYQLTLELIDHFRANPQEVPPAVSLYLIPSVNPDGLALNWRFDGAGVDLNRNMNTSLDSCPENDWQVTVQGAQGIVSDTGGLYPDSQVESRMVRSFLLDAAGAIFLHSNAGLVFPAFCDHQPSIALGQVYAEAAGYRYSRFWPHYEITGGMHDWAAGLGIAAIIPELVTGDQIEFAENLAGLQAVLASAERVLSPPADQLERGVPLPGLIWRYWRAYGGEAVFGPPLEAARPTADGLVQSFERARLEVRYAWAGTPYLVQPQPLGRAAVTALSYGGAAALTPGDPGGAVRVFPETGYTLREAFLDYWERNEGLLLFGYPLSEEFIARAFDGQERAMQYFERAVLAYYPEDGSVRPEPLGLWMLQRELAEAAWINQQIR